MPIVHHTNSSHIHVVHRDYTVLLTVLAIAILCVIRLIPEINAGKQPIGYDSSSAYVVAFYTDNANLWTSLRGFNLLYYIFEVARHAHADSFFTIKATAVAVYTLMAASFALVLRSTFKLRWPVIAISTLAFGLEVGTLRLSWDLYRNELGLIFTLLSVALFSAYYYRRRWPYLTASLLCFGLAFGTHQIAAALAGLLLATTIAYAVGLKLTKSRLVSFILTCVLVAASFIVLHPLLVSVIGIDFWSTYDPKTFDYTLPFGLFSLFFSWPLIALATIGVIRRPSPILLIVTLVLLFQSFSVLILRTSGFFLWDRWMLMLAVPLAIYGAIAIDWIIDYVKPIPFFVPIAYLCLLATLATPSIFFLSPNLAIGLNDNPKLFTVTPSNIRFNTTNIHKDDEIALAASVLIRNYDQVSPIVVDWRYQSLVYYYLQPLMPHIKYVNQNHVADPNNPTVITGRHYTFGPSFATSWPGPLLPGTDPAFPVNLATRQ